MAYTYLAKLSPRQKMWFMVSVVAALLISALGILREPDRPGQAPNQFTVNMSIREIAPKLGVTGKGLARELALPLDTPKNKPLNKLGISQEQLEHATAHILSHRSTGLKYYLFAAIVPVIGWCTSERCLDINAEMITENKFDASDKRVV